MQFKERLETASGRDMKITILKGSPRKDGNTNSLLKVAENEFRRGGAKLRIFELHETNIKSCLACRGFRCEAS